jgi:hypothetical protein
MTLWPTTELWIEPPCRGTYGISLLRLIPARWASWQRARQAGVLSPNDVRREEGWPASTDPTADSIAPPNTSAQAAASDQPPADNAGKFVSIEDYRGRHA